MGNWTHHHATVNGIAMHWVEQGPESQAKATAPAIVLCHGFPHLWLSWHRQIEPLARAGWRVIVPDMRGMGQTEAPADPAAYDAFSTAGDLAGLLDHLGLSSAVFAGLDFGIFAIYDLAHLHPERVRAIIALENPAYPERPDVTPLAEAAEWATRHFVHIDYFVKEPGKADADLAAQPRKFLERVFYALSGDYHYLDVWQHPPGTTYIDALPQAPALPWSWLESWEMDWLVSEYSRTGFTGGLNWYRAMDIRWHQRTAWRGKTSAVPFHFIGSENDVDLEAWHGDDPLGTLSAHWSNVRSVQMVPKAGHMLQLERSDEVTSAMLEILQEYAPV